MTHEYLSLSGYDDRKELLAQRYHRAGKSLFVIALPIHLISSHMPIPDPDEPFEGNRTVSTSRAAAFGEYWRQNVKWATPPLLLDTLVPLSDDFTPRSTVSGVDFGIIRLPHNSSSDLQILDGQHRILGWTIAARKIGEELKRAREKAVRAGDRGDAGALEMARREIARLTAEQERLRSEYVTVEILEGVTLDDHKQYFHDIATNAKGITKSLTASFDRRSPVNRVAMDVAEQHPLLVDRVDFETDTVRGRNDNWISGKNLTDIVSALTIGSGASMTVRRKRLLKDEAVGTVVISFLDALLDELPVLRRMVDGELDTVRLRETSLLGSPTILRGFAGAYHEVAVDASVEGSPQVIPSGHARMKKLFSLLADEMGLPINDGWYATGLFPNRDSAAPGSKTQELRELAKLITRWARTGEPFKQMGED